MCVGCGAGLFNINVSNMIPDIGGLVIILYSLSDLLKLSFYLLSHQIHITALKMFLSVNIFPCPKKCLRIELSLGKKTIKLYLILSLLNIHHTIKCYLWLWEWQCWLVSRSAHYFGPDWSILTTSGHIAMNMVQTFMLPRGWILTILVIFWLFL